MFKIWQSVWNQSKFCMVQKLHNLKMSNSLSIFPPQVVAYHHHWCGISFIGVEKLNQPFFFFFITIILQLLKITFYVWHYVSPLICFKHQTVGRSQLIALIYDGAKGYLRSIFRVWIRVLNQSSCGRDPTHSDDRSVHPAFPRIKPAQGNLIHLHLFWTLFI